MAGNTSSTRVRESSSGNRLYPRDDLALGLTVDDGLAQSGRRKKATTIYTAIQLSLIMIQIRHLPLCLLPIVTIMNFPFGL